MMRSRIALMGLAGLAAMASGSPVLFLRRAAVVCGLVGLMAGMPVLAQSTLAVNTTGSSDKAKYYGQSFLVTGSGTYTNIQFSFLALNGATNNVATTNVANGTLYLFDHDCTATCSASNLSTQGGIASQLAVNNVYSFDPGVTLTSGKTYYAYADTSQAVAYSSSGDPYPGGQAYNSMGGDPTIPYNNGATTSDVAFRVSGTLVSSAPEPATWSLMILGFGIAGGALRRQRRAADTGSVAAAHA